MLIPTKATAQDTGATSELELGRRIYNEGVLPSGAPLTGMRSGSPSLSGAAAACVNCHRRSGMGQVEGDILVPPIAGNFLFAASGVKQVATMDPRVSKLFNQAHDPYNDATLTNAIHNGINNHGREMSVVMPHFNLSEPELKVLTAYLKQLSAQWSPGVTQSSIRFATVITPDVDPERRKVLIDMMRSIFRQKNGSTEVAMQGRTRHHMTTAAEMVLGTERKWELDIWELQGAPESWDEQLTAHYRNQPVFALVSGVSNSTWQPVQDFCGREHVPCWFPSVELPGKNPSPYAFYFSGGVTLEAEVLARHLLVQNNSAKHMVQIYHDDEVGRAAAQALTHALAGSGIQIEDRILRSDLAAADSLRSSLGKIKHDDVLMLWLRPEDMGSLDKIKPVSDKNYFSSVMAGAEQAPLPAAWRANSYLIYPYELPEKRVTNLAYFHAWLNIRKIPLVDEKMQSEAFFAMNYMTDTLSEMLDNIYRDYLLERAETMLSKREGSKAEQETRDRVALGRVGDMERKHGSMTIDKPERIPLAPQQGVARTSLGTTIYPHLSLGPDQRFASKGAYIVQFANGSDAKLIATTEWIVP